jgi:glycosyltransferase involved in cell wall biosynthesis
MRLLFALPGFHRVERGAEVALLAVARALSALGEDVTIAGSGKPRAGTPYRYFQVPCVRRERLEWAPRFPPFRSETAWEDATFAAALLAKFTPQAFDATLTCSFPFTHWALRRPARAAPRHVFVTQNGDWPARSSKSEYRFFNCDGLVCTNPDYFEANRQRWNCALIPNGVDLERFSPGKAERSQFGLPDDKPVILMVSALIESKRVLDGIRMVSGLDNAHLVVAGDGPLRGPVQALADELLPGRFTRLSVAADRMPGLYRSADAFLHMSLTESFGNVYLEAWACGLPIVAHDSASLRWILGDGQFLCDTTTSEETVTRLRQALERGKQPPDGTIERFTWPEVGRRYQAFLREIVGRSA